MPRQPNPLPTYRRHKKTGRAIITVRNHLGARQDVLLPGAFDSRESRREYERYLALILANRGQLPAPKEGAPDLTITEIVLRYIEHAKGYYITPGRSEPTTEMECLRVAFRPLNRHYGPELASDFDSVKLRALQEAYAAGSWMGPEERAAKRGRPLGMARTTINRHVDRIRRLFRWACADKLVSAEVVANLDAVPGLKARRCTAREAKLVRPIGPDVVDLTLPHLPSCPADIIRLLLLTGARVGELLRMRGVELDRSGPIWLLAPTQHKGRHRGDTRVIAFGPRAQLILRRYLKDDAEAYLFVPSEQDGIRKAQMRDKRRSRVQPSQVSRARPGAYRKPGRLFDHNAINHAIKRACVKAKLEAWHVHQLRHTAALTIMREHGIEAARSTLGHKQLDTTLFYSGIDVERAKEVASKIG